MRRARRADARLIVFQSLMYRRSSHGIRYSLAASGGNALEQSALSRIVDITRYRMQNDAMCMQDPDGTDRVATLLHQACRDVGFFYIHGHGTQPPCNFGMGLSKMALRVDPRALVSFGAGMPDAISDGVRQEARQWFNMPVSQHPFFQLF